MTHFDFVAHITAGTAPWQSTRIRWYGIWAGHDGSVDVQYALKVYGALRGKLDLRVLYYIEQQLGAQELTNTETWEMYDRCRGLHGGQPQFSGQVLT